MNVHDTPSEVDAIEGEVVIDGPGSVAVSLTPDAAIETAERLLQKGVQAKGQEIHREAFARERREFGLSA